MASQNLRGTKIVTQGPIWACNRRQRMPLVCHGVGCIGQLLYSQPVVSLQFLHRVADHLHCGLLLWIARSGFSLQVRVELREAGLAYRPHLLI